MESNKLNNIIKKNKLTNIIKVILLLIVLFLVYRIFIESLKNNYKSDIAYKNIYEEFDNLDNNNIYGNVISLNDPKNIPTYYNNSCIFNLSDTFRIDTLIFYLNTDSNTALNFYNSGHDIKISFTDSKGNIKYINGVSPMKTVNSSPPIFIPNTTNTTNIIKITSVVDENDLPVYTSRIILNVYNRTTNQNIIINKLDTGNIGYVEKFGIYGGDKNLPSLKSYNEISNILTRSQNFTFLNSTSLSDSSPNQYVFKQNNDTDRMIYSLKLSITRSNNQTLDKTNKPYNIKITYQNKLYSNDIFTINTSYIVHNGPHLPEDDIANTSIFLAEPILANKITFTVPKIPTTSNSSILLSLNITSIIVLDKEPSTIEISDYQKNVNLIKSSQADNSGSNICPSINEIIDTQKTEQELYDNMEYQDKIKTEKLRLERNKQYLLKLNDQKEQIDQLNTAIQSLKDKRQARADISDQVRVLQYQKQKGDASTIRDLANQRLESQANNQLYMDLNFTNN